MATAKNHTHRVATDMLTMRVGDKPGEVERFGRGQKVTPHESVDVDRLVKLGGLVPLDSDVKRHTALDLSRKASELAREGADDDGDEAQDEADNEPEEDTAPHESDIKADWVAYARGKDPALSEEDANKMTKPDLIAKYAPKTD